MSFSSVNGYIPSDVPTILLNIMNEINTQFGTSYTYETFVGTNFYKYFYALAQRVEANEIKTSEVFLKLQEYFNITNEVISHPVATAPGLIAAFKEAGFVASVKPIEDADAGKLFVCVDVDPDGDDFAAQKLAINTLISEKSAAGVVSQGDQVSTIVLSNGQSFDFKFATPTEQDIYLKLTITLSENNQEPILSDEDVKALLLAHIAGRYQLGKNFEPQRYFSTADAPWAGQVVLEWSTDDITYYSTISELDFDEVYRVALERTTVVNA